MNQLSIAKFQEVAQNLQSFEATVDWFKVSGHVPKVAELDRLVCGPGFSNLGERSLEVIKGTMASFDARTVNELISK